MHSAINGNAERAILAQAFVRQDVETRVQAQIGAVQHFAQDREIFCEGGGAEYFYKVLSGAVRTCKFLADGRRQIDAFYVPGDIFGLEPGANHALSAEAVTDCTVIAYRKNKLDMFAADDRDLSHALVSFAMRGMVQAQQHSLLLGRRSAVEKVTRFLLDWAKKSEGHEIVSLVMTRQDIADYLGLTIETVSRTLSQLERDGVIDLPSTRQIRLHNISMLEELAA